MANRMLHRCPINNRLTTTMNGLPIFSTFFLLLLRSQTFSALPTSPFSTFGSEIPQVDSGRTTAAGASSPSSSYDPTYSYSSYRPGTGLEGYPYRPYKEYYPNLKQDSAPAGLYVRDSLNPNSIYSPQSSFESSSRNLNKVLQFIEKEVNANDLRQQQELNQYKNPVTIISTTTTKPQEDTLAINQEDQFASEQRNFFRKPESSNRNNKPRLLPLPSIEQIKKDDSSPVVKTLEEGRRPPQLEPLPTDPIPPPFAPELDPQYERRQYGLGALTLLDQAAPFW